MAVHPKESKKLTWLVAMKVSPVAVAAPPLQDIFLGVAQVSFWAGVHSCNLRVKVPRPRMLEGG